MGGVINNLREMRIIPVAIIATAALLVLKALGLFLEGGYTLGAMTRGPQDNPPLTASAPATVAAATGAAAPRQSWAQEMFNFPDVTGAVGASAPAKESKPPESAETSEPFALSVKRGWTRVAQDAPKSESPAERALLERLQERRTEIETREKELDLRENLMKAAEKRMDDKVGELKAAEQRVTDVNVRRDEADAARFKNLVTMYENMKAKDAARIFDRLDIAVLIDVATQINPRRMSDILGQMSPEAAERLTVHLANRVGSEKPRPAPAQLPKIEGRPTVD